MYKSFLTFIMLLLIMQSNKHIFGIIKRCFPILEHTLEYTMNIQVRIISALATIHNFIYIYNTNVSAALASASNT